MRKMGAIVRRCIDNKFGGVASVILKDTLKPDKEDMNFLLRFPGSQGRCSSRCGLWSKQSLDI